MNQETIDKYIESAHSQFNTIVKHPNLLQVVSENLFDELLDEIILEVCFDSHRIYKRGYLNLFPEDFDQSHFETMEADPSTNQSSVKCLCPMCKTKTDANFFARHLANCMGLGRNSSRIANMKITSTKDSSNIYTSAASDNENDDWCVERKRKKRDNRNSNKRKHKIEPSPIIDGSESRAVSSSSGYISSSSFKSEEKPKQICGVITKHSKKRCKNINCSHHVDQRKRNEVIDFQIDIENNDELNAVDLEMNSNTSSPNSSHSSTKKREKSSKNKSKSSKKNSRYSD